MRALALLLACAAPARAAPAVTVSGYAAGLDYAGDPAGRAGLETQARVDVAGEAWCAHATHTLDVIGADDPGAGGQLQDLDVGAQVGPRGGAWWLFAEGHALVLGAADAWGGAAYAGLGARVGPLRAEVGGGALRFMGATGAEVEARVGWSRLARWLDVAAVALVTADDRAASSGARVAAGGQVAVRPAARWLVQAEALAGRRAMALTGRGQVVQGLDDTYGPSAAALVWRDLDARGRRRAYAGAAVRDARTPGGAIYLLAIAVAGASVAF